MNKIQLREVAVTDLNLRYARDMGNNTVRHYTVSALAGAANPNKTPLDLVKEKIQMEEGSSDIELVQKPKTEKTGIETKIGVLAVTDVSKEVLKGERSLRKALGKRAIKRLLYEYNFYPNKFEELKDRFFYRYNRFALTKFGQLLGLKLKDYVYRRRIVRASFISIAFESEKLEQAKQALLEDLKTLHSKGLIMGHLAMPSVMELADTVGLGRLPMAMFCFVFVDQYKAAELLGKNMEDLPNLFLSELGVKYESVEGGLNYLDNTSFSDKYKIEEVFVPFSATDTNREAYLANYEANKEFVNEVAARQKQELDQMEKVSSDSVTFGEMKTNSDGEEKFVAKGVLVNVELKKKDS